MDIQVVDVVETPPTRSSVYDPIIEQIKSVAPRSVVIDPGKKDPKSVKTALQSRARVLNLRLRGTIRESESGETHLYLRLATDAEVSKADASAARRKKTRGSGKTS